MAFQVLDSAGKIKTSVVVMDAGDITSGILATARGGTSVDIASAALPLGSGQITFPATQNASAGVNVLDDYEEGTWTPVLGGSGGTSGQTYITQLGGYIKMGRLIVATYLIVLSAKGVITGNAEIQGLPIAADSSGMNTMDSSSWASLATNWVNIIAFILSGGQVAQLRGCQAAATTNLTQLTTADIADSSQFYGTLKYFTSA